jgi:CheY-like chemotaxis protein
MTKAISIVDDEASIRGMIDLALRRAGYECLHAADTNQARAVIAAQRPDLILLDWMLPGQSGIEFAFVLKKSETTRDIPIIMLTARTEKDRSASVTTPRISASTSSIWSKVKTCATPVLINRRAVKTVSHALPYSVSRSADRTITTACAGH